jgi:hypothetical protein
VTMPGRSIGRGGKKARFETREATMGESFIPTCHIVKPGRISINSGL